MRHGLACDGLSFAGIERRKYFGGNKLYGLFYDNVCTPPEKSGISSLYWFLGQGLGLLEYWDFS